jgi:hypothetical protein
MLSHLFAHADVESSLLLVSYIVENRTITPLGLTPKQHWNQQSVNCYSTMKQPSQIPLCIGLTPKQHWNQQSVNCYSTMKQPSQIPLCIDC